MTALKIIYVAWNILRYPMRDKVVAFFMLILPFAIIGVIGMVMAPDGSRPLGIVVEDGGPWADQLVGLLSRDPVVRLREYRDASELKAAVRRENVTAGVLIPAGFDAALTGGRDVRIAFIVEREEFVPAAVRQAVNRDVVGVTSVALSTHYATELGHVAPWRASRRAAEVVRSQSGGVRIEQVRGQSAVALGGVAYTAPGNLVLFIFLNVVGSGSALVGIRQLGIGRRVLSTSTGGWVVTLGEGLGRLILGLVQAAVIVVVGALAFKVHWGAPAGVFAVVGLCTVTATAFALILAAVLNSMQQAFVLGPAIILVFGMLGGCLWPLAIVGDGLRTVGHFFPLAWAMDAILRLGVPGANIGSIAMPLAVLTAFAVASTAIAIPAYLRKIRL
ncbi:MAG TPA: ABC transporter permease [Streptosporangiaceae bacterium]